MNDREPQDYDKDYMFRLATLIQQTTDARAILSVCFSPIIARASKPFGIPYISYTVDSPCSTLYSKTMEYPHNRLFLFDKLQLDNSGTAIRETVSTHCLHVISSILTTLQYLTRI